MNKFTTMFTTTMITLALLMAAPTAMADPGLVDGNPANNPAALCLQLKKSNFLGLDWLAFFGFKNQGECVAFWTNLGK